ncbi:MAG: hypothetical protein HYT16_03515 [DPANN group archaeon]|nr:hypothetical protein [DPANN group archaeon]
MAQNPYIKPLGIATAAISIGAAGSAGMNLLLGNYGRAAVHTIASAGLAYETIGAVRGRLPDGRGFGLAAGAFGAASLDNLFNISGNGVNVFVGLADLESCIGTATIGLMPRILSAHRKSPEVEAAYERVKGLHPKIRQIQNDLALQIYGRPAELKPARVVSSGWQHFLRGDILVTSTGPTDTIAIDSCLLKGGESKLTLDQRVLAHIANTEGCRTANYLATRYGHSGGMWDYEFTTVEAAGDRFGEKTLHALGWPAAPRRLGIDWAPLETDEGIKAALREPFRMGKALYVTVQ